MLHDAWTGALQMPFLFCESIFCCCCCSVAKSCPTLCNPMDCGCQAALSSTISWILLKFMTSKSVMPSNHLILCCPLLLLSLLSSILTSIRVFSHLVAKVWSLSFRNQSFQWMFKGWFPLELTGLISLQSNGLSRVSSRTTVGKHLQHSNFFMVQPSHMYMTTGKTIALKKWTFVGKVVSLLFNMLSRFVTAFLPRSKCLLISWLQSLSAVILEPKKIKSATASTSPSPHIYLPWSDGTRCHDLSFLKVEF